MLNNFKYLENIGTFDEDCSGARLNLERLTLIYGENGSGKTTLSAIMRSLATGQPEPILERKRLVADTPPKVILAWQDPPKEQRFIAGKWNEKRREVYVFDDVFVDRNVHSGLRVDSKQRQKLHEVILGDQGVSLAQKYVDSKDCATHLQKALNESENAIPQSIRGELAVKEFCDLPEIPNIDGKIEAAKRRLSAAENREDVQNTPLFETIELPILDVEAIRKTLQFDLESLDRAAEDQVQAHLRMLGEGGESWIEKGLEYVDANESESCPFCNRGLAGVDLIAHYRAFFSEGYQRFKREVGKMIDDINVAHSSKTQASFQDAVSNMAKNAQFWSQYTGDSALHIDLETVAVDWTAAREAVIGLLQAKQAAPLARPQLEPDTLKAISSYERHQIAIEALNRDLVTSNERIRKVKREAETSQIEELNRKLGNLETTKRRHSDEIDPLCEDYYRAVDAKADAEDAKLRARDSLEKYRVNIFPQIKAGINEYLHNFYTGFSVDYLEYSNRGSTGSTCEYGFKIGRGRVKVGTNEALQKAPWFGSSLSAGDRNTFALSLFFSTLFQNADLSKAVVVIDDPVSSLDFHRLQKTADVVSDLSKRAAQVIVMSHNKPFLLSVWEKAGNSKEDVSSLEIRQIGEKSTFREWDVSQEYITEHDKRHHLLKAFYENRSGDKGEVARAIRPHLESYFRITCPDRFRHDSFLGKFLGECFERVGSSDEILNEEQTNKLKALKEFANPFHHAESPWHEISEQALLGYVRDTLEFIRPLENVDLANLQHSKSEDP